MKNNFVLQLIQFIAIINLVIGVLGLSLGVVGNIASNPYLSPFLGVSFFIFVFSLILFGFSEIIFQLIKQNQILERVLKKLDEK